MGPRPITKTPRAKQGIAVARNLFGTQRRPFAGAIHQRPQRRQSILNPNQQIPRMSPLGHRTSPRRTARTTPAAQRTENGSVRHRHHQTSPGPGTGKPASASTPRLILLHTSNGHCPKSPRTALGFRTTGAAKVRKPICRPSSITRYRVKPNSTPIASQLAPPSRISRRRERCQSVITIGSGISHPFTHRLTPSPAPENFARPNRPKSKEWGRQEFRGGCMLKTPTPGVRGCRGGGGHVRLRQRERRGGAAWAASPCPSCPSSCCANTRPPPRPGCISKGLASMTGATVTASCRRPCSSCATAAPRADPSMAPAARALPTSGTQGMPNIRQSCALSAEPAGPRVDAPSTRAAKAPLADPGRTISARSIISGRVASARRADRAVPRAGSLTLCCPLLRALISPCVARLALALFPFGLSAFRTL